ncbi:GNAT family N-acetyltransferase [Flavobacterium selenitireducens]|uniref:GNAT family N-acetyltransferase n=1 Tax=Flavobacterium selenitireducens TaxID=2722704 RepID=UPI00168A8727|nr:GNAT family N-acetyltransferase [Flavobacterium selenitireducens]MBD3581919.1 GNAT family N-acetyltransferase [Flavobacterium selenitireducens]
MLHFERAKPSDAGQLSGIAHVSKQNWGYSNEQLASWRTELTLTHDYVTHNHVVRIFFHHELIGFYAIIDGENTELDHLWLLPQYMRKGFGSLIFADIRRTVATLGKSIFRLVAEPHAKGFYDKMNGVVIGSFESKIPGRFLEIYEFTTFANLALADAKASDFDEMAAVWQSSVAVTHDFLNPDDFEFFKELVYSGAVFRSVPTLKIAKIENRIVGFLGVSDDNLEMLFVHDDFRAKGIGKLLLGYALDHLSVRKVEVNKDNIQAVGFYEKAGFRSYEQTGSDGLGKPYPLLRMSL